MKREFTTVTRVFRLFADVFDLNAILPKLSSFTLFLVLSDFCCYIIWIFKPKIDNFVCVSLIEIDLAG